MKKLFVLMVLSSFSLVSADKYLCRGCCCDWNGFGNSRYWEGSSYDQPWNYAGDYAGVCCDDYGYGQSFGGSFGQSEVQSYGQRPQWGNGSQMVGFQRVGDQFQVSDAEISKKVYEALSSGKSFQDLVFRVDGGIVTIRGPVDSAENKTKVEETVKNIDGVKHVNSQIGVMVARPAPTETSRDAEAKANSKFANDFAATDSDKKINAKVREKLSGGWFRKGYDALIIRTNNGLVVITGNVETQDEATKLPEYLKGIEGIKKVNVQVAVKKK